jgi:hypothetical protein
MLELWRLEGWNEIPDGYGALFDIRRAPLWLRLWFRTPILDKFAYPVVVRRGFGHLTAHPGWVPKQLGDVGPGRHIDPDGLGATSEVTPYHCIDHPGRLRRRRRRYARAVWSHCAGRGLTLPTRMHLPGGLLVERQNHLFWRIRLPLLAVLGSSGALIAGWTGVILGLASAILVELLFSYRRLQSPSGTSSSARPANPAG